MQYIVIQHICSHLSSSQCNSFCYLVYEYVNVCLKKTTYLYGNQKICLKINFLLDSATHTPLYTETPRLNDIQSNFPNSMQKQWLEIGLYHLQTQMKQAKRENRQTLDHNVEKQKVTRQTKQSSTRINPSSKYK